MELTLYSSYGRMLNDRSNALIFVCIKLYMHTNYNFNGFIDDINFIKKYMIFSDEQ